MPTFVGILTQSLLVFAIAAFGWNTGSAYLFAAIGALVLAFAGAWLWEQPSSPSTPKGWLLYVLAAPVLGCLLFAVDIVIGRVLNPSLGYISAALQTGPFGGMLTAVGTPALMLVAIGGLARSVALQARTRLH